MWTDKTTDDDNKGGNTRTNTRTVSTATTSILKLPLVTPSTKSASVPNQDINNMIVTQYTSMYNNSSITATNIEDTTVFNTNSTTSTTKSSSQHVHVVPFTNKYKDTATKDDDKTTDTDDDNISTNTTVHIPNNQSMYSCTYTCRVRSCGDFEISHRSDSRI